MTLEETLNELLVKLFKDILEIEAKSLITEEFKDITYNDMHIIEAVGIDEPRNMKTVAKLMSVTTGTLTKAMDALCEKGYVVRERSTKDKRVIKLRLTDKGKSAYYHHEQFHRQTIKNIASEMSEQETDLCFGKDGGLLPSQLLRYEGGVPVRRLVEDQADRGEGIIFHFDLKNRKNIEK